ncbi:MAG: hypothetical protein IJZ28_04210 [Clostridia bacterium]|nr:hypothetical protein [Clostridia bacterium]MBQ7913935.1 hypothetical protein [Clostridia bacterium]MBQ8772386.1 hypothetical protein [Clostridia bacterium]MBR7177368.1 hypothetical protein [Clostridia bacterium]
MTRKILTIVGALCGGVGVCLAIGISTQNWLPAVLCGVGVALCLISPALKRK